GNTMNERIFNNLAVQEAGDLYPTNGFITACDAAGLSTNCEVYNNTVVGINNSSGGCIGVGKLNATKVNNNIMYNCGYAMSLGGSASQTPTIDYNTYYNIADWYVPGSGGFFNFSAWQGLGFDAHG